MYIGSTSIKLYKYINLVPSSSCKWIFQWPVFIAASTYL